MFIMFHSPGSMSLFLWDWWNTIKNLRFCPSPFWVRWYGEIIRINITWQFFDPSRWSSIRFPLWDHIYILNHVEHCTLCVVHVTMKILYYSLLINYYSMSSFSLRHPTYPHLSPFQTASSPCGPGEIANMIGLTRPYTEITYVRYLHWAVPNILVGSLRVFWYIVINSYIYIYTIIYLYILHALFWDDILANQGKPDKNQPVPIRFLQVPLILGRIGGHFDLAILHWHSASICRGVLRRRHGGSHRHAEESTNCTKLTQRLVGW